MKNLLIAIFLIIISPFINATEQQPDYIEYQNETLRLSTGWGHPSPLEDYYSVNKIKYPFKSWHTANYRGHIATWAIEDDQLFLKEVTTSKGRLKPGELNIQSKIRLSKTPPYKAKRTETTPTRDSSLVLADWFNGVIDASRIIQTEEKWEYLGSVYFYIRNGQVIKSVELTKTDYDKLYNEKEIELSDESLKEKQEMLKLNHDYISYYFRLNGDDVINYEGQHGRLATRSGFSPILAYYSNDHMKWPFNWTNKTKSGAPKGEWLIEKDKLYLTKVKLNTGTGFYEVDEKNLKLEELFSNSQSEDKVPASWLSGVFLVKFGEMVNREGFDDYSEFKVSEYVFLRVNKGNIIEAHKVEGEFNFKDIPYNTLPELTKIIDDFRVR
ncbi:MAG: hypothetical protein OQJ89_16845 [Kangiellaceae bacterium]|nr:hypothetical protein [Kangiellaceae bacterium]MCW9018644.1 hypothetical protein [Kangiellaceae bacterium]